MTESTSKRKGLLGAVVLVVSMLLIVGLLGWGLYNLLAGKSHGPRKPPKIFLLPDRPPPPPPPPPKQPEPKVEQKEVKAEPPKEPQPQAQNEPLKMEGAAGEGPSAFAAGAVSKDYIGGDIGADRMQNRLFIDRLQRHIQDALNRNRKLRQIDYRVTLRVWLAGDGAVQRVELIQSTGNANVDALLKQALLEAAATREAPPADLPQPIRIRVTTRGAS